MATCDNCGAFVTTRPVPIYDPQPTRCLYTYTCDECDYEPDPMWSVADGRVTVFECHFYSHRAHLMQRGFGLFVAHTRAINLARYLEARCLRANG